jgi:hypothetical protein
MSLVAGNIGEKVQCPDGIQVDHISENTVGHGVAIRVRGIQDGASIAAGDIGEEIIGKCLRSASINPGGPEVTANLTSIIVTAGVWDISGMAGMLASGGTPSMTRLKVAVSRTSATLPSSLDTLAVPNTSGEVMAIVSWNPTTVFPADYDTTVSITPYRFVCTSNTTLYLVVRPTNTVSNNSFYGSVRAVRVA